MLPRLLSLVLLAFLPVATLAQTSGVLREVYENIGGSSLSDLTNHPSFPASPTAESIEPAFEAPAQFSDNYGTRMRALLSPPASGNYVFYIASDDQGVLYLGTDDTPASKRQIASVAAWTSVREWTKEPNQRSSPVSLVGGRQYYIEALQKEGGGGDNLSVGWTVPGINTIEVIPGSVLAPYGLSAPIIAQEPSDATAVEGSTVTFSVRLERTLGATYQWQREGTNVTGAVTADLSVGPIRLSESGHRFQCFITNALGSAASRAARLTVTRDLTPPVLQSVGYLGDLTRLTVLFSEPVEPASALNRLNYALDAAAQVLSVSAASDPSAVILRVSPLEEGRTYTLTVSGVRDQASAPNTIAPGSQRSFSLGYQPLAVSLIRGRPESPGPATRRGPIAITELMYHPATRSDGRNLEFIELYNAQPWPEDLSGYRLTGDIDYVFPTNTTLPELSYLVVAAVPADLAAVTGVPTVHAFSGGLPNDRGTVRLRNALDAVVAEVTYGDDSPWPAPADGAGPSLVLNRPSYGQGDSRAWSASRRIGGSPGGPEPTFSDPLDHVLINEFLAHTDDPQLDFIELFNYGTGTVDLSGCALTDDPATNRYLIPANTVLGALGHVAFDQWQLGFALNAAGETLYLKNAGGDRILDAVRFGGQANGVATGRTPDGAPEFSSLAQPTPGAPNAGPRAPTVVLNEIQFEPILDDGNAEYIELYNPGTQPVNLAGWRLEDAVTYTLPPGVELLPQGHLVVAQDPAVLMLRHPQLNPANTLGPWSGSLANRGERLVLTRPDTVVSTNSSGVLVTNTIHIVTDEVTYRPGGRWGRWSAGGGSSLERIDPRTDGRAPGSWADSDEAASSQWVTVETTGTLDNGNTDANRLELFLLGPGEALVDDVVVLDSGSNLILPNGSFAGGLTNWVAQGNQSHSVLSPTGGPDGSPCLHLRATGRGDTGANRVRAALTATPAPGSTATLRARVRWLAGQPNILLRLHGNWLDVTTNILTTQALGTPGRRNSQSLANTGPAITDVTHEPILPGAYMPVEVLARVQDSDGLGTLFLRYRVDPATNWIAVAMTPRGAGYFSGTIPGQAANRVVAFHVDATDAATQPARSFFPANAPKEGSGVIVFGAANGHSFFGSYHLWMTAQTVQRWSERERLSNDPLDLTFVYNGNRVVYNVGGQYSGSPYHSPGYNSPLGNYCDYVLNFPPDDPMLGETDLNLLQAGNGCCEGSLQREQTAFWFARQFGIPYNHRRHVHVFANNQRRAPLLMEDSQQANGDFADQWWGGEARGDLHKIQLWFEMDDQAATFSPVGAGFGNYTTSGGQKKLARYRVNWARRAAQESVNNYTNLFALHDTMLTAASGDAYTRLMEATLDVDEWARTVACEHLYGNVDSFCYGGGQNLYVYRPQADRWRLILWDLDFAFSSEGPDANLFSFGGNLSRLLNHPPFLRNYYRALRDAATSFLPPTASSPPLDARYRAFTRAGLGVESPQAIKDYMAIKRQTILNELARVATAFSVSSPPSSVAQGWITLTGSAPVEAAQLTVNGLPVTPTWLDLTTWQMLVPLTNGPNPLLVEGRDRNGALLPGLSQLVTVTNAAPAPEDPTGWIVLNEIQYNPDRPGTSYVELFNRSPTSTFGLAGWRLAGADLTFDSLSFLPPQGYLVLPRNTVEFVAQYGPNTPLGPELPGDLDNGGERLRLLRPLPGTSVEAVVDDVRYDDQLPWPPGADGTGASLQLIDAAQDNRRVGNWAATRPPTVLPPQPLFDYTTAWRYQSNDLTGMSWTAREFDDTSWSVGPGLLYLEDAPLPAPKNTPLPAVMPTWYFRKTFTYNQPATGLGLRLRYILDDGAVLYLNGQEIHRVRVTANPTTYTSRAGGVGDAGEEGPVVVAAASLVTGINVLAVEVKQSALNSSDVVFGLSAEVVYELPGTQATPGQVNGVAAVLAPFPNLWINEIQPLNWTGPTDNAGEREPWLELFNAGATPVSLDGLGLATTYTNIVPWAFPDSITLPAQAFLPVWLDGEPAESVPGQPHTSFRLPPDTGSICLVRLADGPRILDYVDYDRIGPDRSYGSVPDGDPYARRILHYVTPAATNNPVSAPIAVRFNEWMSDNPTTLADPADGDFEDWFELHNASAQDVELGGFYLTDRLTNSTQYLVPPGRQIPAHGFLLVWADDETSQNTNAQGHLHVPFRLANTGEELGLFAPDGTLVDGLVFGPQPADASDGRFPDSGTTLARLPYSTPGLPNADPGASNAPPALGPLPSPVVTPGQTLAVQLTATDPDLPPQSLAFSLGAGAPAGCGINPVTGLLTWPVAPGTPPGAYPVTVQVTDNGTPPLTASAILPLTVIQPPTLGGIRLDGQAVELRWMTQPGLNYRVLYKNDLAEPEWIELMPATPGTGAELVLRDDRSRSQKFYLLVVE